MSDYEQHIGRIKPVYKQPNEAFYTYTKRIFGDAFKEECWREYEESDKDGDDLSNLIYECDLNEKAFLIKDVWYVVVESKEIDSYDDIQELLPQADGSYVYIMRFYNGGTCLEEMLEEALEKLEQ